MGVDAFVSAIESGQTEYIENQRETLLSGTFLDWLDHTAPVA